MNELDLYRRIEELERRLDRLQHLELFDVAPPLFIVPQTGLFLGLDESYLADDLLSIYGVGKIVSINGDSTPAQLITSSGGTIAITQPVAGTTNLEVAFTGYLRSLNGDTTPAQVVSVQTQSGLTITELGATHRLATSFSVGTAGTDFTISWHAGSSTLRWDLPDASLTARGVVNIIDQTFNGHKTFDDYPISPHGGWWTQAAADRHVEYWENDGSFGYGGIPNGYRAMIGVFGPGTDGVTPIEAEAFLEGPDIYAGGSTHTLFTIWGAYGSAIPDPQPSYAVYDGNAGIRYVGMWGYTWGEDTVAGGLVIEPGPKNLKTVHVFDACDPGTIYCLDLPASRVRTCSCGSSGSGSSPGSGSGSGSGGSGISRASLGTASVNYPPGATSLSLNITVAAGTLLIVNAGASQAVSGVTFNGTAMAQAIALNSGGEHVSIWYLFVGSTTTANVVASTLANAAITLSAVEVMGLANNTLDKTQANSGAGAPDVTQTPMTAFANEYVQSAFYFRDPGSSWTWLNSYASGGQDVSATVPGYTVDLSEGYRVLSAIGQPDAALGLITPIWWAGVTATFS